MELQALSNAASYSALEISGSGSLSSGACCNDAACNCIGGKAAEQQQLATQNTEQSAQLHLGERALELSRQVTSVDAVNNIEQSGHAKAGLQKLFDPAAQIEISPQAQRAIRAYQAQAGQS